MGWSWRIGRIAGIGRLVGVLTRNDLTAALERYGPDARVRDAMQRDFVTVDPKDMLQ